MSHRFRSVVVAVSLSVALSASAVALASAPVAHTAGSCGVGSGHGYGYTYLTSLSVHRTSCANGKRIAGKHGHVSGWHCSKHQLASSPVQNQARETCSSGSRQVKWTYTQNK